MWTKKNIPDLTGKVAIVTGANTGIGYETAKALYEKGAKVTIASRNMEKASAAMKKIRSEAGENGHLETRILDLANLGEIRDFGDDFKSCHQHLDILVNNAGVMIPPASKTVDGFELQFGINFIGHFALTGYLIPLLKATPKSRVVNLSSGAATLANEIDFENLKLEKTFDEWRQYAVSKLANILFTYEMDRRIKSSNGDILSVAAHPGVTRTDLQRHIPNEVLTGLFAEYEAVMDPWQGALPVLFAATDSSVKGGEFYGPDGDKEYNGYPTLSKHSSPTMRNTSLAKKLWEYAEAATQIKFLF